jgi:hypothetical protein
MLSLTPPRHISTLQRRSRQPPTGAQRPAGHDPKRPFASAAQSADIGRKPIGGFGQTKRRSGHSLLALRGDSSRRPLRAMPIRQEVKAFRTAPSHGPPTARIRFLEPISRDARCLRAGRIFPVVRRRHLAARHSRSERRQPASRSRKCRCSPILSTLDRSEA